MNTLPLVAVALANAVAEAPIIFLDVQLLYSEGTGILLVVVPSLNVHRSVVSFQVSAEFPNVPLSTSIPASSVGVPVQLELSLIILSVTNMVSEFT